MANLPSRRERRGVVPARWDTMRELEDVRERMERLFDDVLGGAPLGGAVWSPAVDLEEADDAWIVEADLPGVRKGDVNVEVRDNERGQGRVTVWRPVDTREGGLIHQCEGTGRSPRPVPAKARSGRG